MNGKHQNASDYYLHRYEGYVTVIHFIGAGSMNLTFSLSETNKQDMYSKVIETTDFITKADIVTSSVSIKQ